MISVILALWVPIGTAVFLYWVTRIRPIENGLEYPRLSTRSIQ